MTSWHIAQVNIARLLAPIDAPEIAEFVAQLDPVNARADAAPGFVWRLQDDDGNATHIEVTPDPLVILNMSVWESIDALADFVALPAHAAVMRGRRQWFEPHADAYVALWWIPAGETPTVADALKRLEHINANGPTEFAFTFRHRFDPPDP